MEFDEIMKSMISKLTGNYEEDMDFLNNESEKYKTHECYLEIIKEIGGLSYDILPDSDKRKIEELYVEKEIEKVDFMIRVNKSDEGLLLLEAVIKELENMKWHLSDDRNGCYNILRELYVSYSRKVANMKKLKYFTHSLCDRPEW
jgi:aromatic ring hydroxylase